MKRTRLALGMLVTLMLAVGAIAAGPSVAFAAEGANLAMGTGAALQTQATSYGVWVGGKQVTSANANNVLGDGRVSYNAKTNTLTLKNAKITNGDTWYNNGRSFRAAIDAEGSNTLTIQLVGTNTVKTPYSSAVDTSMGISCDGLVIKGSGKLTVSGAKAQRNSVGVLANKLTVKGSAKLDAKGASVSSSASYMYGGYGIDAISKMTVSGKAQVTASGTKAAFYGYEGSVTPTYGSGYTPYVKAGASSKSIAVKQKKPASSVYTSYKYVKITKYSAKPSSSTYRLNHTSINLYKDQQADNGKTYKLYLVNSKGKRVNASRSAWQITSVDTKWNNYSFNYDGNGNVTYLTIRSDTWFNGSGSGPEYGSVYVKCTYKGYSDICQIRVKNSYLAIAG